MNGYRSPVRSARFARSRALYFAALRREIDRLTAEIATMRPIPHLEVDWGPDVGKEIVG